LRHFGKSTLHWVQCSGARPRRAKKIEERMKGVRSKALEMQTRRAKRRLYIQKSGCDSGGQTD